MIEESYRQAAAIVSANKELIETLIPILVEKESMEREECEEMLASLGGLRRI